MDKNKVIARTTIQRVMKDDLDSTIVREKMNQFDMTIKEKMNKWGHVIPNPAGGLILDNEDANATDKPEQPTLPNHDDFTNETYDAYLGTKLMVPHSDTYIHGHVIKQLQDEDGDPIGHWNNNPLLDT